MASLMEYVVQYNSNHLPSYCYAEETLMADNRNISTTAEELNEPPLVSPRPSFAHHENNQQPRSKLSGFVSPNEYIDRFNTPTSYHQSNVYSNLESVSPPVFGDLMEDITSNPFLNGNLKLSEGSATSDDHYNVQRQMFIQFMQESAMLQLRITRMFREVMNSPPITDNLFTNYITLLYQFNNVLKMLLKEMESRLANANPTSNSSRNRANDTGPSPKAHTYFNPNCESFVKQDNMNLSRPISSPSSSSTANLFDHHTKYHCAELPTADVTNLYAAYARSFKQAANHGVSSHQADTNNPHIQQPPISSCAPPEPPIYNSYENIAEGVNSHIDQLNKNMPSMMNNAASYANISGVNPPNYQYSANKFASNAYLQHGNTWENKDSTKSKETNPFRLHQEIGTQVPATQSKNNYDMTNLISFLPDINLQSHTQTVNENTNTPVKDNFYGAYNNTASNPKVVSAPPGFKFNVNSNGDYAPRIVYEGSPVMYNVQKKSEEQQLPSHSATQLQSNNVAMIDVDVDHAASLSSAVDVSVVNDETYVTPTTYAQNSLPTTSKRNYYQPDISSNVSSQHVSLEGWNGAMFQNSDPEQDHNKTFISPTMNQPIDSLSQKKWHCEINKEFMIGDPCATTKSNFTLPVFDNSEGSAMTTACANLQNSSHEKDQDKTTTPYDYSASLTNFLFQRIRTCGTADHISFLLND
ncbi:hypothetical protein EAI_07617 [Harpegnathos saltator]|uniref:Uncharacterized protein n=1 Tax=Harpegnathos saltator TaxID=610380 RepID=E2BSE0_HARSA|nr:hypothetical protein EAI_07617 [Harpegnathos saltator]